MTQLTSCYYFNMSFECNICNKYFSTQFNLNKHIRNVHKTTVIAKAFEKNVYNFKCLEHNCDNSFRNNNDLILHLSGTHNIKFEYVEVSVASLSEFNLWKASIEGLHHCNYIFKSRCSSTNGEVLYYNCNPTVGGKVWRNSTKQYSRMLKSQGSCKLENACTSVIKVVSENNGHLCIKWQKTHYGHECELQHIRLAKEDRQMIASQLMSGVPAKRILESTRDKIEKQLKRIDILTSKDINNVKTAFNIELKDGKRHANDAISIDLWVEECNSKPSNENPIIFYKRQGETSDKLQINDFCLIIMNSFQKSMFQKFGSNIVAIDGTHGLNGYDFELTTIMVLDEFSQGFPVSFMFSNRKDTYIYTLFFEQIRSLLGIIKTQTFMSDLAEAFYNAWLAVMGPAAYQLYCSWHVDRAWQSNLNKISNLMNRNYIYKVLKVLQQESNERDFQYSLQAALKLMLGDKEMENFAIYFKQHYASNFQKWAYCFRKNCGINTNMHLESMHKVIKYFYLDRKTVKRLDIGLSAVLKFLRDKSVERLIKLTKGKNSKCDKEIFLRHNNSLTLNYNIEIINDKTIKIIKQSGEFYVIERKLNNPCCHVKCFDCKVCIHMLVCTCRDYTNKLNICKHIHYVQQHLEQKELSTEEEKGQNSSASGSECILEIIQQNNYETDDKLNEKILKIFYKLQNCNLSSLDDSVVAMIHKHLNVISTLITLPTSQNEEKEIRMHGNDCNKDTKNGLYIKPQLRFSSTKRKPKENAKSSKNIV